MKNSLKILFYYWCFSELDLLLKNPKEEKHPTTKKMIRIAEHRFQCKTVHTLEISNKISRIFFLSLSIFYLRGLNRLQCQNQYISRWADIGFCDNRDDVDASCYCYWLGYFFVSSSRYASDAVPKTLPRPDTCWTQRSLGEDIFGEIAMLVPRIRWLRWKIWHVAQRTFGIVGLWCWVSLWFFSSFCIEFIIRRLCCTVL